jgi:hypothetical protein
LANRSPIAANQKGVFSVTRHAETGFKERLRARGAPIGYGHSPKNWKRAATISRFPAVKIFKNGIFEKREIVAAHFSFWGNAHTRLALLPP